MPIAGNPALPLILQTVQMIANENMIKERQVNTEQRAEDRQIREEDRTFQRQLKLDDIRNQRADEVKQKQQAQTEYDSLTQFITDYPRRIQVNEPDPKSLKAAVQRREVLIKQGLVTPGMKTPSMMDLDDKKLNQKPEYRYRFDPKVAAYFKLDPQKDYDEVTYRILSQAYRDGINKANEDKKGGKGGGGTGKGLQNLIDPNSALGEIRRLKELGLKRYNEGIKQTDDTEKLGINPGMYQDYMNQLNVLEQKIEQNQWTQTDADVLAQIEDFDRFYGKHDANKAGLDNKLKQIEPLMMELGKE